MDLATTQNMITTIFLLLLLAFEICYLTSKQFKEVNLPPYVKTITLHPKQFRTGAGFLFVIATSLLIIYLGLVSGIFAVIVGLMAAGSLIVIIQPFRYIPLLSLLILYFSIFLLEIFI